ncbi:MIP/aquaporin family protein [uncultured Schumannella sp.]|uniref:aquaporin n=1 Tax=uncultured Schumannella sp. TaxID=1195956 RepID=UPI0025D73E9E|nr:MIP/aquaporin family protein [uncultured Schumannella sp.]
MPDSSRPATDRPTARLLAEFLGSAGLAVIVLGSGVMASRLTDDVALQLLGNAWATALGLAVLIAVFASISGAHFNPVVTLVDAALGGRRWAETARYIPTQVLGCIAGAIVANFMFELPAISWSTTERATPGTLLSELVATAGLVLVIFALVRTGRGSLAAPAVGAYIGGAYFFTSSTSFANPAITIGRIFSDSFAGIAAASAPWFIAAQLLGAGVALVLVTVLFPAPASVTAPARLTSA